jgi:hypothetical protein
MVSTLKAVPDPARGVFALARVASLVGGQLPVLTYLMQIRAFVVPAR